MPTRAHALAAIAAGLALPACGMRRDTTAVGSKNFTESLLLGELYAQLIEDDRLAVRRGSTSAAPTSRWRRCAAAKSTCIPNTPEPRCSSC